MSALSLAVETQLQYLSLSSQRHQKEIFAMLESLETMKQKLITIQSKSYAPWILLKVFNGWILSIILSFMPLKQQVRLRLVSSRFNTEIKAAHIQVMMKTWLDSLRYLEEEQRVLFQTQITQAQIPDMERLIHVELANKNNLNQANSWELHNMGDENTHVNQAICQLMAVLLKYPEAKSLKEYHRQYAMLFFKSKETFAQYLGEINIFCHEKGIELLRLIQPLVEQTQQRQQRFFISCLQNLIDLRDSCNVPSQEIFFILKDNQLKRAKLIRQIQPITKIYKINEHTVNPISLADLNSMFQLPEGVHPIVRLNQQQAVEPQQQEVEPVVQLEIQLNQNQIEEQVDVPVEDQQPNQEQ